MDQNCKTWTTEEKEYLQEAWGNVTLPTIMQKLGRSENAIKIKAQKLKLGAFLDSGDYITLNQLSIALGHGSIDTYKMTSWVKNRDFPIHMQRIKDKNCRVVHINEFWKWAERHKAFVDWSRVELYALGEEPRWVAAQRKADFEKRRRTKATPWSKDEDAQLITLLNEYKYSYLELSKMINRTSGAIQRRTCDLGIKARPLKADNHDKWTAEQYHTFAELIKQGCDYETMGDAIGKSSKALRGRTGAIYQTENLDTVVSLIGGGTWGDGAPPKKPRLVGKLPRSKATCDLLSELCGAIVNRIHQIAPHVEGWDDFFQRFSCMNWNDAIGCLADETNCDNCNSFQRIRPQYCKRCGGTFLQRAQSEVCTPCRKARVAQHMKKFAILNRLDNQRNRQGR